MFRITLGLALVATLAAPAAAQTGRISGSLTDETGAVLPAVEVRAVLRDDAGQTTRSVATDGRGTFDLGNLEPGTWVLNASLPGFETATNRTDVNAGDSLEWSPTLQLGMIQETVTITTDAPDGPLRRESPRPPDVAAPPRAAPAGAGPIPIRVGGSVKPPRKVVDVRATYPPDAAAQGVSGVVILSAVIGADGLVRDVKPLRSPNASLTQSATVALTSWEFTPTLLNGGPVDTRMTVVFNFLQQQ